MTLEPECDVQVSAVAHLLAKNLPYSSAYWTLKFQFQLAPRSELGELG